MSHTQTPAAGPSGTEITAPQAHPDQASPEQATPDQAAYLDDAYRRIAVEELAVQLTRGSALLAQCEVIAKLTPDGLGPIREAARLMNANAALAKALARLAQVERRSRTIVETDQKPEPKIARLNARFPGVLESEILRVFALSLRRLAPQPAEAPALAGSP